MRKKGFTLSEVLFVILIIAVLSAILLPIFAQAKISSKKAGDIISLGQCSKALALYAQDFNESEPVAVIADFTERPLNRVQSPLLQYSGSKQIFRSIFDRVEGRGALPLSDRAVPQSFRATWLLWEGETGEEAWKALKAIDSNPIMFRNYFADDRVRKLLMRDVTSFGPFRNGSYHAARADTSVKYHRKADRLDKDGEPAHGLIDEKASTWGLATDEKCPPSICDGVSPPGGIRY